RLPGLDDDVTLADDPTLCVDAVLAADQQDAGTSGQDDPLRENGTAMHPFGIEILHGHEHDSLVCAVGWIVLVTVFVRRVGGILLPRTRQTPATDASPLFACGQQSWMDAGHRCCSARESSRLATCSPISSFYPTFSNTAPTSRTGPAPARAHCSATRCGSTSRRAFPC